MFLLLLFITFSWGWSNTPATNGLIWTLIEVHATLIKVSQGLKVIRIDPKFYSASKFLEVFLKSAFLEALIHNIISRHRRDSSVRHLNVSMIRSNAFAGEDKLVLVVTIIRLSSIFGGDINPDDLSPPEAVRSNQSKTIA